MQFRARVDNKNGTTVEVIDPTDGSITHSAILDTDEQIIVTATTANSPADIEFGDVEAIPEPETTDPEPPAEDSGADGGTAEPTTSAASEKPLYRIFADLVPEGFVPSGLASPDGFILFHYEGDTAGYPHTAEVGDDTDVGLYAEADDNEQPVIAAPAEGESGVEHPSGSAEGAEAPAKGTGTPAEGGEGQPA